MDGIKSQNQIIAEYLQSGKSITPLIAQKISGSMNLAQRIADLKRPPHNLNIEATTVKNNGSYYCSYKLKKVKIESLIFFKQVTI